MIRQGWRPGRREPVAGDYEHQVDVYTAVWLRWAYRRFRELTPTHGQRGAVAVLLREARGVTTTARLIRRELRGSLELRSETRA